MRSNNVSDFFHNFSTMSSFVVKKNLCFRKDNNSWLILEPNKDAYLEMSDVAACIWSQLQQPSNPESIAKQVAAEYEVDFKTALKDVREFLTTYTKKGLLQQVV